MLTTAWLIITKIPSKQYKDTDHTTVQFVDDDTHVIGFKDHSVTKNYLESYFALLTEFYNANKLKINAEKTNYIIVCKKRYRYLFKKFSFLANNCVIKPCRMIKILGTYLRDDLSWETEMGKTCRKHTESYI